MAYKNTNTWSEKIMKNALRKYWELFCRNTCFESILQCVLQNCWEEFRNLIQNQQLLCKNSETWSASSYITTFYSRTPKYNKQLLRVKSVANFWYSIKKEKIYTGERRSYDLLVRRNKINNQKKNRMRDVTILSDSLPPFFTFWFHFCYFPPVYPGWRHFWMTQNLLKKVLKQNVGTSFIWLLQSRNLIGWFTKHYSHRAIEIVCFF